MIYEAPEVLDIPFSEETVEILDSSVSLAKKNRHTQVIIPDLLYRMLLRARNDRTNPLFPIAFKREEIHDLGISMKDMVRRTKSPFSPYIDDLLHSAQFYAAALEDPKVTPWHLGFAFAADEFMGYSNYLRSVNLNPKHLMRHFTGE